MRTLFASALIIAAGLVASLTLVPPQDGRVAQQFVVWLLWFFIGVLLASLVRLP